MICKNCKFESEKDFKYCPECGLATQSTPAPAQPVVSDNTETEELKLLKDLHTRTKKVEEYIDEEKKRRSAKRTKKQPRGILDIFSGR